MTNGLNGVPRREYVILRGIIVPLAHDFFSVGIMKRGEGLVRELAHQVFCAVDFKRVELEIVGGHGLALLIAFNVLVGLFYCVYQINFLYYYFA
jgi:hypothetical protein